jgi:hypothetical protein
MEGYEGCIAMEFLYPLYKRERVFLASKARIGVDGLVHTRARKDRWRALGESDYSPALANLETLWKTILVNRLPDTQQFQVLQLND